MTQIDEGEFGQQFDRLFIHFGVEGHFLKLETFIETANSAERVVEALNESLFQGSLNYELIILPPESGTFLSKIGIWVGTPVTAAFGFICTPPGAAYVEALTGHDPTYWFAEAGYKTLDAIEYLSDVVAEDEVPEEELEADPPEDDEAGCRAGATMITAMARGVLEKDTAQLGRAGMDTGELRDALDARADFYLACLEDPDVKKIGFTSEDDFPIPRNSFPARAQRPERKRDEDDEPPWLVSIENIYVTSPNWDRDDQRSRQWKGKDQIRRDCYFVIEDAEFWGLVRRKELHVEVLDNLLVQWACQVVGGRAKNRRVLRVLEFNGEKLAEPLSSDAIQAILGDHSTTESPRDDGPSLFEWQPN